MQEYKVHIPISRFGFIEHSSDDLESLLDLHDRIAISKRDNNNSGGFKKIRTFTNEIVYYNDARHVYQDIQGNILTSGSKFAAQFGKKFDKKTVLPKFAAKCEEKDERVEKMWKDNSSASCDFGNAIHKSLENYFTYRDSMAYKLPKHPFLQNIVTTFPHYEEDYIDQDKKTRMYCVPEAMVSSLKRYMVGQIDNVIWIDEGDKLVDIWDYKTAGKLNKDELHKYSIQVNYYRAILEFMGFKVRSMFLYNWDGKWIEYKIKRMDLNNLEKNEVTL